jgi:hypothetical protein
MLAYFRMGGRFAIASAADIAWAGGDGRKIASGKNSDQRRCNIGKPIRELKRESTMECRFAGKCNATGRRLDGYDIDRFDNGAAAIKSVRCYRHELSAKHLEVSLTVV